jgi:hypothetical protein
MNGFGSTSLASTRIPVESTIRRDVTNERSPYLNPVSVTRGTMLATLGGITEVRDATGGTVLFTIDPTTGTVTIAGGIVANQTVNIGTINNSVLTGNIVNTGTVVWGVGTAGTIYCSEFNASTVINSLINASTITNAIITTPSIRSPLIQGTSNYSINTGSSVLTTVGAMEIQTYGTAPAIAIYLGGTTFRFSPSGTI